MEGLFPHKWIIEAHDEHPVWFKEYSVDVEGKLQPFDLKSNKTKDQLRNFLINKAESSDDVSWVTRFEQVFDVAEKALESQYKRVYGCEM